MAPKGEGKVKKRERKAAARRLRGMLAERPMEIGEMMSGLDASEAMVLEALRELGEKKRSRLRSGMVADRPCWWWEKKQENAPTLEPTEPVVSG
jgi:hypothetical protein